MTTGRKTLLLIDDQPDELSLRKIILEHSGYTVLTAVSGREGLQLLASDAIDEVLLDYQMPEMNGGMVAAEMRKTHPGVPILLISGCVSLPKSVRRLVDGFIAKGVPPKRLLVAVERRLNKLKKRKPVGSVSHSRMATTVSA
jgi:two-component system response regulator GlrR